MLIIAKINAYVLNLLILVYTLIVNQIQKCIVCGFAFVWLWHVDFLILNFLGEIYDKNQNYLYFRAGM